jgi:short-subunit dehydrogenase
MNPTALITGASSGIGLEIAKELARQRFDLILVARREDRLNDLAALLEKYVGVTVLPFDLACDEAPQQLFDALKGRRIDLLVNNAGFADFALFADASVSKLTAMMHVNMISLTNLTRLFLPAMLERGSGRILNVGSIAGYFPGPLMTVYYATKAYVGSFSEALANEVGGSGVTVTCLCPGATNSEFQMRARMRDSKLASSVYMSSKAVARRGVKAALRGDRVCIPGLINRFIVMVPRIVPRGALPVMMRLIQERIPRHK